MGKSEPVIRPWRDADADEVSALIARTLRESNAKDYPPEYIEQNVGAFTPEFLRSRTWCHMYVVEESGKLIGCGGIAPYYGKRTESILLSVFVHPGHQGRGLGRRLVETLENDEFALRAERIEVPASITACEFYRALGYDHKGGVKQLDEEQHYPLEKFRAVQ